MFLTREHLNALNTIIDVTGPDDSADGEELDTHEKLLELRDRIQESIEAGSTGEVTLTPQT